MTLSTKAKLLNIYRALNKHSGHLGWWPGQTQDEIIIGAILTQNVAWKNVEKAIASLAAHNLLSMPALYKADTAAIAPLIVPTRYYNVKAKKLKNLAQWLKQTCNFSYAKLFATPLPQLRQSLLKVNGIGEETADSILLYAGNLPTFVIDAYTKRAFLRIGFGKPTWAYAHWRNWFMSNLPTDVELFNDYHAQIVVLGYHHCKAKPVCQGCPLLPVCQQRL